MTTFENPIAGKKQYRGSFTGASEEHGTYSFDGTGLTVEVPTYLSSVLAVVITPAESYAATDLLYCDMLVELGNVTVTRRAGSTGDLTFNYTFIGLT